MVKSNSSGAIGLILIVLIIIGISMLAITTTLMNSEMKTQNTPTPKQD